MNVLCPVLLLALFSASMASASIYGHNANIAGSLSVAGKTSVSSDFQIGSVGYSFPSSVPASGEVLVSAESSDGVATLSWSNISLNSAGSSVSLVNSSASPNFLLNGLKGGEGIDISPSVNGDITITNTITLLDMWPIGSIYISVSPMNPGSLFGGTWVAFAEGQTLVGLAMSGSFSTQNSTGGTENTTLLSENLPAHNQSGTLPDHVHPYYPTNSTSSNINITSADGAPTTVVTSVSTSTSTTDTENPTTSPTITTTCSSCSGTSFSNMPPYIVVSIWQRTA